MSLLLIPFYFIISLADVFCNGTQNSVFEGELTKAELVKVRSQLKELIDENSDHIIIYSSRDKKYLGIENLGTPKADINNII